MHFVITLISLGSQSERHDDVAVYCQTSVLDHGDSPVKSATVVLDCAESSTKSAANPPIGRFLRAAVYFCVRSCSYMYPRHLLCRHFWTPEQRLDFALHDLHRHRLPHYGKIIAYLRAHSSSIRDRGRRKVFAELLSQVWPGPDPGVCKGGTQSLPFPSSPFFSLFPSPYPLRSRAP